MACSIPCNPNKESCRASSSLAQNDARLFAPTYSLDVLLVFQYQYNGHFRRQTLINKHSRFFLYEQRSSPSLGGRSYQVTAKTLKFSHVENLCFRWGIQIMLYLAS